MFLKANEEEPLNMTNTNAIETQDLDEQALFSQALSVVNQSLERHKDETPYKQIIQGAAKLMGDTTLAVGICKETGSDPYDYYTVRYADGRFDLTGRGKQNGVDVSGTVTRGYLENVVETPDRYLEHPEKLDLDWVKDKLGIA